jgi:hypothetical protein
MGRCGFGTEVPKHQRHPVGRGDEEAEMSEEQGLSDDAIERMKRERFQQRVQRVLEVMREERIDWRGAAFITADGRVAVRVLPVESVGHEGGVIP